MRRVLMIAAALSALAMPAFAYDYVNDILIGNTVELTNKITGQSVRFQFKADNTVTMLRQGLANEVGNWRQTDRDICTTFASVGSEVCRPKPLNATVPGEVSANGKTPDGKPYDIVVKWMVGEVGY